MTLLLRSRRRARALLAAAGLRLGRPAGRPRLAQIEITARCDLFCRTCTRGKLPAPGDMSLADFTRVLDQLGPVDALWLSGQGEPLLHPDLPRMVRACAERGITGTIVHTNGMQLRGARREELATAGLGELKLSVDGGTAEDVEYLRDGSDLERILENAAAFARISPTPVVLYTVLNRRNAGAIARLPELAARAGARRIEVSETVPFRDGSTQREVFDRREYQFASLPADERRRCLRALRAAARERGLPLRLDLRWERTRCREPMQKLYVDFRGNVTPCCRIHHEVLAGNIFDSSLDAVWFGPTLRRWRRALRRREEHPRICVERCHLGLRPHR